MSVSKILVTGASGALGTVVVKTLLDSGLQVVAVDHTKKTSAHHDLESVALDLTNRSEVRKAFSSRTDIDGLVHCAGGFRWAKFEDTKEADLDFLMKLNFDSAFTLTQTLLPAFKKKNSGKMIFISAKTALNPPIGMPAYCASKAALNAWILSCAEEFKNTGLRINAILPTIIDTPANRQAMGDQDAHKWVKPQTIADLVSNLLKDQFSAIHGALIPVSGDM